MKTKEEINNFKKSLAIKKEMFTKDSFYRILYKQMGNKRRHLRKRAKYQYSNMDFNLDNKYLMEIFPRDYKCPYTGLKMSFGEGVNSPNTATVDRIDTTKGYIKGNIEWISMHANRLKSNMTYEKIKKLYQHMKKNHEALQRLSDTDNKI
jgi:hypothetical protein